MKLVPFILTKKKSNSFTITKLSLFLAHAGKSLWQTDESGFVSKEILQSDYLEPNGLIGTLILDKKKQIAFVQIDATKTKLSDFYSWEEALGKSDKPECWRHFYFIKDQEQADWWSPKGLIEAELQDVGNIGDFFCQIESLSSDT